MKNMIEEAIEKYKLSKKRKVLSYAIFSFIAFIIIFITIYNLIFPAIALTGKDEKDVGIIDPIEDKEMLTNNRISDKKDITKSSNNNELINEDLSNKDVTNPVLSDGIVSNKDEKEENLQDKDGVDKVTDDETSDVVTNDGMVDSVTYAGRASTDVLGYEIITDLSKYTVTEGTSLINNLDGEKLTIMSSDGRRILGAYFDSAQAVGNPIMGVTQNRWSPGESDLNLAGQYWILKAVNELNGEYQLRLSKQFSNNEGSYDIYLSSNNNKYDLNWGNGVTFTIEKGDGGIYIKNSAGQYLAFTEDDSNITDQFVGFTYISEKNESALLKIGEYTGQKEEEPTKPQGKVTGYKIIEDISSMNANNLNGSKLVIMSPTGKRILGAYNNTLQAVANPEYGVTQNRWNPNEEVLNFANQYWILEGSNGTYTLKLPFKIGDNNTGYLGNLNGNELSLGWDSGVSYTVEIDPNGKGIYLKLGNQYVTIYGNENIGSADNNERAYFGLTSTKDENCLLKLGEAIVVKEEEKPNNPTEIPEGYDPIKNTVTPFCSVMALFDYKANDGDTWNENAVDISKDGPLGINKGHALYFRSTNDKKYGEGMDANVWVGEYAGDKKTGAVQGIVKNKLVNGYPELSGTNLVGGSEENLSYLFDREENENKKVYPNVKDLLQVDNEGYYYYDSEKNYAYYNKDNNKFIVYGDSAVTYDGHDGQFFPFNDIYEVNKSTSADSNKLNHYFGMSITSRFAQKNNGYTDTAKTKPTKFQFGGDDDVWIYIDDVLVADMGGIRNKINLEIDFVKGTVTISDVYGQNGYVTKEFSEIFNGTDVELDTYKNSDGQSYTTLKNDTTHTLKFFYLERGGYASNLMLRYNLADVPPTYIQKVNQYGESLPNAKFAVYAADENYNYKTELNGEVVPVTIEGNDVTYDENSNMIIDGKTIKALYVGTTDIDGKMTFYNNDFLPLTLDEMKSIYGEKFILREVESPIGHRPISIEIPMFIENGMLKCKDSYESGVLTSPTVTVTAPNNLYIAKDSSELAERLVANGNTDIVYNKATNQYEIPNFYNLDNYSEKEKGTLFAVVLKRNGRDSDNSKMEELNFNTWDPIYGSDYEGYTVSKYEGPNAQYESQIEAAIGAAKKQLEHNNDNVVFHKESSGMQTTLYNFPGDFERYYSYMEKNNIEATTKEPQFLVAYYWTTADTINGATKENTMRIASHKDTTQNNAFYTQWASTIQITNIENRIFFQKRKSYEEEGELLNDAVFALYPVGTEYVDGKEIVYYTANDTNKTKIYLEVGDDLKFTGKAGLSQNKMNGTYTIDTSSEIKENGRIKDKNAGNITVTFDDGTSYVIEPAKDSRDGSGYVGFTHQGNGCNYVSENGTGHFTLVEKGSFVMREIKAPKGYSVNNVEIKVLLNNTGVFANAGILNDGLTVAKGAGYLLKNFNQFGTEGSIDESLTWMKEFLKVNLENTFESVGFDHTNKEKWKYSMPDDYAKAFGTGETENIQDAMVTYIKFSNGQEGTLFDYSQNRSEGGQDARPETISEDGQVVYPSTREGENSRKLYVSEGWSTQVLQQDYAYGKLKSDGNVETYYTDLRYINDLSYLYSGSTIIQVVDDYTLDVNIVKTNDGTGNDLLYLDGAKFKLYKFENGKKHYYTKDANGIISWVEDGKDYAYEFTTETEGDAKSFFRIDNITKGTYYLEETVSPQGYKSLAMPIKFMVDYIRDGNNNVIGFGVNADEIYKPQDITELKDNPYYNENSNSIQYTMNIVNSNNNVNIEINKLGNKIENGVITTPEPLNGAKFKLYYSIEEKGNEVRYYYKSANQENGIVWTDIESEAFEFSADNGGNSFIINDLANGVYYLEETVIPTGYAKPVSQTKITIDKSNKEKPVNVTNSGDSNVVVKSIVENGENKTIYCINVINTLGYELPHTGGIGTNFVYTIGILLFIIGAGGYIYRYKKYERGSK